MIKKSLINVNYYKSICRSAILLVFVLFLILFVNLSCGKNIETISFENSLFYALPDGGISAYDFSNSKETRLTNGLDYYPTLLNNGEVVLFLRLKEVYTGEGKNKKSRINTYVYSYNLKTGKEKQVIKLKDFSPNRDLKDNCFFTQSGKYLLVLSYSGQNEVISLETGERVDLSILEFLPDVNQYDSKNEKAYIRVRQYPRKDIFKDKELIVCPDNFEAILTMDKNFNFDKIIEIKSDNMFSSTFYGFSFSEDLNIFVFSLDKEIYLFKDGTNKKLIKGIHPTFFKNSIKRDEVFKFPLTNLTFIFQTKDNNSNNSIFLCSKNYVSLIDKQNLTYRLLTTEDTISGSIFKDYDRAYLFSNLGLIGKPTFKNDLLILLSYKTGDPNAGPENILSVSETIDVVNFFSLSNGKIENKLSIFGKEGMIIEFRDLDKNGLMEIIVQYSASNFKCNEKFIIAGRSLIWKDIYTLSKDGKYEIANHSFPVIYEELLNQLEPLYSNALAAKRLKQPILCDDDIDILYQLIRNAKQIVFLNR